MPSLGADMETGTLVEWQIAPGDHVHKGQVVAVVETAKGAIDVEVFADGVVEEIYVEANTKVPVGTPLARIGAGADVRPVEAEGTTAERARAAEAKESPQPEREPEPEPQPRPTAKPEPQRAPARAPGTSPPASPAARLRAREAGIDLATVEGSGPDGVIVLQDVEALVTEREPPARAPARAPAPRPGFDATEMRRAIAAAMSRSKREIPHYYLATTIDLKAAEAWLDNYNHDRPPAERVLLSALFMKATAIALASHRSLNGHYVDDEFVHADAVNLGMAIHLRGGGLVAPAILDADTLALPELMTRLQDLVQRARSGGLRGSEISGASATLTALGERGVDTVWGVIHPPQVAMIGFGRPTPRPMAIGDALAVRPAVNVSLAADHRVCDGHLGALFLGEIDRRLQQPEDL